MVEIAIDEATFNAAYDDDFTRSEFAQLYSVVKPGSTDTPVKGGVAGPYSCLYCSTETYPVVVDLNHLKRPVVYAFGEHSVDGGGLISTETKWRTGARPLPDICGWGNPPVETRLLEAAVNFSIWIIKEMVTEPILCSILYKGELEWEIAKDLPGQEEDIVDDLVGFFIWPWSEEP